MPSKHRPIGDGGEEDDDEEEEELEGFDDFTIASSWERFISEIEAVCRQWLADGPANLMEKGAESQESFENLFKVKRELKYGGKVYCMEYYFSKQKKGKVLNWDDNLHNMQLSFGVADFLVIAPISASGVVLDDPESTKLLSAVAIALSNCGSTWSAFVPVHDPSRNSYIGIQNMGTIFTRRFEADRIASQVPVRLMHLEGLHELFLSKFVLSLEDFPANYLKVHFTMKLTYQTPPFDYNEQNRDLENMEQSEDSVMSSQNKTWDDDCPWAEWYSAEDPVQGFQLVAIWKEKIFEESLEMAELENASSLDADAWFISPLVSPYMVDDSIGKFVGFASQLRLLVNAFEASFSAQFMEDFTAADKHGSSDNSNTAATVPPPTVLDRVLKDIFSDEVESSYYMQAENKYARAIKGAPRGSLFAQFCLYTLWIGNCNIRALAVLWIDFVREVSWCWEELEPLPKMPTTGGIDLSTCLIHQKLQMLEICIERRKSQTKENGDSSEDKGLDKITKGVARGKTNADREIENIGRDETRRGSAGAVQSMLLLNSFQEMHAPYTQSAPVMTEDMHEERLQAAEALGSAAGTSGQLERDILSSDMSSFKAANPDAVFEDFIRWHSPRDWETDEVESSPKDNSGWPPKGKLSQRMAEHGNMWRKLWNECQALPVSEQKPLFDPVREGEKALHYLETLRPQQLLEQIVCGAFRSSAELLNETRYGSFKLMKTKVDQLFHTMASTLKSVQGNANSSELIGDLNQLCLVFEHIEKLLILAASIYRKLLDSTQLAEATFTDYFNFYLPKMGTSLSSFCYDKKFNAKQPVRMHERDTVSKLFPQPTATQSWRKVLSMGNLLNGHEPVIREIIFSVEDRINNGHYGTPKAAVTANGIETHRMYIRGTSNDLWAALAVTSWD